MKVLVHCTDVTAQRDVQALYDKIIESDFKVDVLINNAGHLNNANIGETEPSLWWNDFVSTPIRVPEMILTLFSKEVNVKGPFLMIHHFTKHFTQGTIINMTTAAASLAVPGLSSYIASKLAMLKVAECIGLGRSCPSLSFFPSSLLAPSFSLWVVRLTEISRIPQPPHLLHCTWPRGNRHDAARFRTFRQRPWYHDGRALTLSRFTKGEGLEQRVL